MTPNGTTTSTTSGYSIQIELFLFLIKTDSIAKYKSTFWRKNNSFLPLILLYIRMIMVCWCMGGVLSRGNWRFHLTLWWWWWSISPGPSRAPSSQSAAATK